MCVITHTILGILYVFVHLMPGNALFSVHLLTARHQLIWPSTLIYNRLLNKTHFSLRSMQALSGFNVHVRGQIDGADGDAIENIARYMSRAAISVNRVEFNPADNTLTVYERKDRPSSGNYRTYTIMEFMALLAGHIPSPYKSLVYYYGLYSSSHRGKERRENRDDQSIGIQETKGIGRISATRTITKTSVFGILLNIFRLAHSNVPMATIIIKPVSAAMGKRSIKPAPNMIKTSSITDATMPDSRALAPDEIFIRL